MAERPTYEELLQKVKDLEESERKYRHLFDTAMVGIYRTRLKDGKFLEANESLAKMMGYESVEKFIGEYVTSTHYADPERREELIRRLRSHRSVDGYEVEMIRTDGSTIQIALSSTAFPDQGYSEGVIIDITERKLAEESLRRNEERFRTLVEMSPLGISIIGKNGHYHYINPRFEEIFGYTLEDAPNGKEWFRRAFPDDAYRRQVLRSWIEDRRRIGIGHTRPRTYTVTCKDGSRKEIHFSPVTMENQDQFVVYEDITERLRMQQQLQQAQKYEAVGTLAGGIAHDFNNLLMGIQGRASLMGLELGPSRPQQEHIQAIEEYVRSATNLTKQLLGFARGGKYEVRPVDINDLVLTSAEMFGRTRKEIRIHTKTQTPSVVVQADNHQIEQVLLNIFINAWQAMPDGGELYLETRTVALDQAYCSPHQVAPGPYAKVSVTDTGIGMDSATCQRIFDPFFTTKEKSRGTGLGLASAYGIVKNHGGMITVYTQVGHGTTFNVYLPLSDKQAFPAAAAIEGLMEGSETVLLVDDEEMILQVGRAMLQKLGYRVLIADGYDQAVDKVSEAAGDIDLVILDLIMPGKDGGKTFDRIREIEPALPVILSSGYAVNGRATEIIQRGCNGFIQKPFSISALSQKIRSVLDETRE